MKTLAPLLFLLSINAFCQYIEPIPCNQVGSPDWSIYETYLIERNIKIRIPIRERDANIKAVTPEIPSYEYVVDELYLRWTLTDNSIAYSARIANIMDTELIKIDAPECAIKIYPDSLLEKHSSKMLIITIQQKRLGNYPYWGVGYAIKPMERDQRASIRNQMRACSNFECQLNVLLERELYIDALSFIEGTIARHPSDAEYLQDMYWKVANEALIGKR